MNFKTYMCVFSSRHPFRNIFYFHYAIKLEPKNVDFYSIIVLVFPLGNLLLMVKKNIILLFSFSCAAAVV